MLIKYFLGVLITALSTYFGCRFAASYRARLKFYRDFAEFNERFYREVAFYRGGIGALLVGNFTSADFSGELAEVKKCLAARSPYRALCRFLSEAERAEIENYFNALGKTDADSQLKMVGIYRDLLVKKTEICREEEKKYGTLYIKLGFLFGIAVFVVIL